MKDFARTSIFRKGFFGTDSIQGLLELATWYNEGNVFRLTFNNKESTAYSDRLLDTLKQLEKEGYITLQFSNLTDDHIILDFIRLTISGHKLLSELRDKSTAGELKKRIGDLAWVILTSIATTLVVLWITGK